MEFDPKDPITLAGEVTKMEFMNPHIYLYLNVKGKDGKVVNWALEGSPPNVLYRQGWRKDTVKPGDMVTVKGFRARDGSHLAFCTTVTFPDGREISPGRGPWPRAATAREPRSEQRPIWRFGALVIPADSKSDPHPNRAIAIKDWNRRLV